MNTEREAILSRVNGALVPLSTRAPLPDWDAELAKARRLLGDREALPVFTERIKLVNGTALTDPAAVVAQLLAGGWTRGYCDPALWPQLAPHFGPKFTVSTEYDRTRVDDYAFGITRAVGAIAETGTIILNDATTSRRLGALAPWVHVAVVPQKRIFLTMAEAVLELGDDPNVIWVTGPSKTADVEGILIEGVHGPGVQIALVLP
ncbi:MAG: LUD domain-containing protein [Opitutae bacterium]|nr:LUD domain-containing protein [Opitutae bacterium]